MQPRNWTTIPTVLLCVFVPICLAWVTPGSNELPATASPPAKPKEVSRQVVELVTVLVARRHVPQGTLLKLPEDRFEARALPRCDVPEQAVTKFDQIKDRVASEAVAPGEPVVVKDLLLKDGSLCVLDKGHRPMAIKVSDYDSLGFQPGSRVDVEFIYTSDPKRVGYTQTILQNLLLLETDPVDNTQPREGSGPRCSTVTLYVTAHEAQLLSLALQDGTLRLRPSSTSEPKADTQGLHD